MPENRQFSIAIHILAALGYSNGDITSAHLAQSVNTSPSFVRRILAKLSKANLVDTTTGKTGSTRLARDPETISLLEIYKAVEAPMAFSIHDYPPQQNCLVSCGIKSAMEKAQTRVQSAMEQGLSKVRLSDVIADMPGG